MGRLINVFECGIPRSSCIKWGGSVCTTTNKNIPKQMQFLQGIVGVTAMLASAASAAAPKAQQKNAGRALKAQQVAAKQGELPLPSLPIPSLPIPSLPIPLPSLPIPIPSLPRPIIPLNLQQILDGIRNQLIRFPLAKTPKARHAAEAVCNESYGGFVVVSSNNTNLYQGDAVCAQYGFQWAVVEEDNVENLQETLGACNAQYASIKSFGGFEGETCQVTFAGQEFYADLPERICSTTNLLYVCQEIPVATTTSTRFTTVQTTTVTKKVTDVVHPPCPSCKLNTCKFHKNNIHLIKEPLPYHQARCACEELGMELADLDIFNFLDATDVEFQCAGAFKKAWINSWNGDHYNHTCLALSTGVMAPGGSINHPESCHIRLPVLCKADPCWRQCQPCEGPKPCHPCPPQCQHGHHRKPCESSEDETCWHHRKPERCPCWSSSSSSSSCSSSSSSSSSKCPCAPRCSDSSRSHHHRGPRGPRGPRVLAEQPQQKKTAEKSPKPKVDFSKKTKENYNVCPKRHGDIHFIKTETSWEEAHHACKCHGWNLLDVNWENIIDFVETAYDCNFNGPVWVRSWFGFKGGDCRASIPYLENAPESKKKGQSPYWWSGLFLMDPICEQGTLFVACQEQRKQPATTTGPVEISTSYTSTTTTVPRTSTTVRTVTTTITLLGK